MQQKEALLLVNVGTPDNADSKSVRRYLFEFLNDRKVIDIPWLAQKLLVNLIIIPFRVKKSTRLYQRLWTSKGSPLLFYMENLVKKVQQQLGESTRVYGAMRYGNPGMKRVLREIKRDNIEKLTVLPLYPQYATSTTASVEAKLHQVLKQWKLKPEVRFISQFYNHPSFIEAFTIIIKKYLPETYDHIVFTYHGLPLRQIHKMHPSVLESNCTCEMELPEHGTFCYKATCYETTRLLTRNLGLNQEDYTVSFQSRLTNNWLAPFTDETLIDLAKNGKRKVLVVAPSFVADCLETVIEIEQDYHKLFLENGGEALDMVHSLNDSDAWVSAILKIIGS